MSGGLILPHFAASAFHFSLPMAEKSDWPEYRKIARRVWNHHGQGDEKSGHDAFGPFTVAVTELPHPITKGLKAFGVTDELYFRQAGSQPVEPLITATSKVTGKDEPLAWTYTYGKGRIFQTLLGHRLVGGVDTGRDGLVTGLHLLPELGHLVVEVLLLHLGGAPGQTHHHRERTDGQHGAAAVTSVHRFPLWLTILRRRGRAQVPTGDLPVETTSAAGERRADRL